MQQALDYAATLDIPFVFSSNGDGFVFHDRTGASTPREVNLNLNAFPSPADLWARYRAWTLIGGEHPARIVYRTDHELDTLVPRGKWETALKATPPGASRD